MSKTVAVALVLAAASARAELPLFVSQHGRLRDAQDSPVNGTLDLKVRFHKKGIDAPLGGGGFENNLVVEYAFDDVQVTDGAYSVMVGPLDPALWDGTEDRWMAVQIGSDPEMTPRLQVSSVPFALKARDADRLGGQLPAFYASAEDVSDLAAEVNTDYLKKAGGTITGGLTLADASAGLTVGGAAALNGGASTTDLTASGNGSFGGTLTVTGAAQLNGGASTTSFTASGAASLNGGAATTDLAATGNGTFGGTLTATGAAALNGGASTTGFNASGNGSIGGTLAVTGAAQLNGGATASSLAVTGAATAGTLDVGSGRLVVTAGGNVGVGTTSPGNALRVSRNADEVALKVSSGRGPTQAIAEFRHDNETQGVGIAYRSIFATGTNANQDLSIFSRGTGALLLNSEGGGNVGIGTATPQKKLELKTTSATGVTLLQTVGGGTHLAGAAVGIGFDPEGYGNRNKIAIVAEGDGSGWSTGKLHILQRNTGDAAEAGLSDAVMTITKTGNVGIGTTAPAAKLHVAGDVQIDGRVNSTGGNPGMSFSPCTSDAASTFTYNFSTGNWGNFLEAAGGYHALVTDPDITIVSNRIKVAKPGKYVIAGNVFCASGGSSNNYSHVGVQQVNASGTLVGEIRLFSHGSPNVNNDTYAEHSGTTMFNLAAGEGIELRAHNHNNPTCYCSQYYNSWAIWKL